MANKLEDVLTQIGDDSDADIFLFSARVNDDNADELINLIRNQKVRRKNCILILTTDGGDPDAGYRIVRCIKQYYPKPGKFILYVFGFCKSTGTLIAVGADELVVGDLGEFGPLDIQMNSGDDMTNTSGLSFLQSLISLDERIYSSFESNFINLKKYGITTKTAAEIGSNLAIGIITPIAEQIDPLKLGEVQRSIKIASEYGKRVLGNSGDKDSIQALIGNYPSHTFVVDFNEMQHLFKSKTIRRPTEVEYKIENELTSIVRKQGKYIYALSQEIKPEPDETPPSPQNHPSNEQINETASGELRVNGNPISAGSD